MSGLATLALRLRGLYPAIRVRFFNGGSRDIQTKWLENAM